MAVSAGPRWTALDAALPLLVLFVLLGVFRIPAWRASLIGLFLAGGVRGCRRPRRCASR